MKKFACGAVVPGCDKKFEADSEDALLQQVAAHAKKEHGMDDVPDEVVAKVRENITEE